MRYLIPVVAVLVFSCTTGYYATSRASGLEAQELAGARRLYLGETPHLGMPHVTMDPAHAVRLGVRLRREMPDIELVSTPEESEFVISVLFNTEAACSHCDVGPEMEWIAIVERGGTEHQHEYRTIAPFLELSGKVNEGFSVTRGFVRQLKDLLRPAPFNPAGYQ